jgi:hypothetical protein
MEPEARRRNGQPASDKLPRRLQLPLGDSEWAQDSSGCGHAYSFMIGRLLELFIESDQLGAVD